MLTRMACCGTFAFGRGRLQDKIWVVEVQLHLGESHRGLLAAPHHRLEPFVAVQGGAIVGMAEIEADGFIDYFYVHPRAQGRGVGKALLAAVECEAVRLGVSLIYADVSITAKSFFLSQGFCITEAKSNVILGHPAPSFRMEKRPEQRKCHS